MATALLGCAVLRANDQLKIFYSDDGKQPRPVMGSHEPC